MQLGRVGGEPTNTLRCGQRRTRRLQLTRCDRLLPSLKAPELQLTCRLCHRHSLSARLLADGGFFRRGRLGLRLAWALFLCSWAHGNRLQDPHPCCSEEQHPAPYHRQQGPRLSVRWQAARVYGGLRRNAAGLSRHAVAPTWPSWPLMKHLCRTVVPAEHTARVATTTGVQSFTAPRSVSDYNTCPGLAHARAPRCKRVRRIVASNHAAWALWMHLDSQFDAGGMVPLAATMIERLCQTSAPRLHWPADEVFSVEVLGTLTLPENARNLRWLITCDARGGSYFLWLDDHMVCEGSSSSSQPRWNPYRLESVLPFNHTLAVHEAVGGTPGAAGGKGDTAGGGGADLPVRYFLRATFVRQRQHILASPHEKPYMELRWQRGASMPEYVWGKNMWQPQKAAALRHPCPFRARRLARLCPPRRVRGLPCSANCSWGTTAPGPSVP